VGARIQEDEDFKPRRHSFGGLRFRLNGGIPRSVLGRVLAGCALLVAIAGTGFGMWELRQQLMVNPRLVLESSSDIQVTGNSHLTRAQLLTVFGEDVERNVLTVPLALRRAELEQLPWVEHATVMRLLPNRFRVAIVERRPVAFVRQGTHVALVDAHGVLLDMASDGDAPAETHYSFPVVTGISPDDPLSVRAARMKLYSRFIAELGEQSKNISEVDLSSPEDIKALIPDAGSDILVHFGDKDYLHRYELYEKNLPGWKSQYPKLASADMRYERQVVLEMQPGSAVPSPDAAAKTDQSAPAPLKAAAKGKTPSQTKKPLETRHPALAGQHLQTAFDVKGKGAKTTPNAPPNTMQVGPP
jgi:cell division protein FtsQ